MRNSPDSGFTLAELLIAAGLTSLVVTLAGSGLMTILNARQVAEEHQFRRQEMLRALEFMTSDIRNARRVNVDPTKNLTAVATTAIVATRGSLPDTIVGTPVLFLEIPLGVCPTTGPNPVIDSVIYEVRTHDEFALDGSESELEQLWRGPYVIYRHGRIPGLNGIANPCSEPVSSEILVDGILNASRSPTPSCGEGVSFPGKAVPSGVGGFYACVQGAQVALMLRAETQVAFGNPEQITIYADAFQRSAGGPPPGVTCRAMVPNVLGKKDSTAKSMLTTARLTHNGIADSALPTPSDVVNHQSPAPGTVLPCGQIVTFTFKP